MTIQDSSSTTFLESAEGEISFFRSIMRARPVGMHRHFHVLTIRNSIQKDTGQLVSTEDIWSKLRSCYDLDALESQEVDGFDVPSSSKSSPTPMSSASGAPLDHSFFDSEYSLPHDDSIEALVSSRRMRATASPPSSPAPSPVARSKANVGRKTRRGRARANMAGLVGGDSDSSALTQESGDEGAPTPRESVVTGTDGGTEYAENDWAKHESSPEPTTSSKPTRGKASKTGKKPVAAGRTRAAAAAAAATAAAGSTRVSKKRKR